jgi:4-hydroxythreonine-4-phosphate dehydrogenase
VETTSTSTLPPVVLADDISGAAEVAATFGTGTRVVLRFPAGGPVAAAGVRFAVVDTDTRARQAEQAERVIADLVSQLDLESPLVKKVDSLLRGRIAAELTPLLGSGWLVVLAPALPQLGRVTLEGVITVEGVPLHATNLWLAESTSAPRSISEVLGGLPHRLVTLNEVRGADLAEKLRGMRGLVAVCDAETSADLAAIVCAAVQIPTVALVGSSALCRTMAGSEGPARIGPSREGDRACLTVVGTASRAAREQARLLVEAFPVTWIELAADELIGGKGAHQETIANRISQGLAVGDVLVTLEPISAEGPHPAGDDLTAALAEIVSRSSVRTPEGPSVDLVLTGGETARAVLDALGVEYLEVVGETEPGAVVSSTANRARVGTRPGSFGGPDSLITLRQSLWGAPIQDLQDDQQRRNDMTTNDRPASDLPIIAVTMGDGAGVGPEVTVAALLSEEVRANCVPVVIGDAPRLDLAAKILGVSPKIVPITDVGEASNEPNTINVIDLGLLPADLPWGKVSAVAGDAAYQYIKVAAELAVAGKVQAICTAPLNKEALKLGGHNFPGHTETLAYLTGTPEVSMMLTSPKLRVIHVTTHIGLVDAVNKIEPGLVQRTIERGWDALRREGIDNPRIGVCAINPHAGENGLFGYGEEETKIIPALEAVRAKGIRAEGPLPADTAFYLGGRGDYDLIVAMYHDQGHGPMKVGGIEAGVNITVGLPVIRTSVDHGTAFDIAGKGIVKTESMVEAMRQAVNMASARTPVAADDRT